MALTATYFQNPMSGLASFWISQFYNGQNNIFPGYHAGVDYSSASGDDDIGDNIRASGNGTVVYSGYHSASYGNVVMLRHTLPSGQFVTTIYAHLDTIYIGSGDVVAGQVIGTLGDAGGRYAAHLHFAVHLGALSNVPLGYTPSPDATPTSSGSVDPEWFLSANAPNGLTLYGTAGNDTGRNAIYGASLNDSIYGGYGNDSLFGGSGNDFIDGGYGFDTINGGSGVDTTTYAFYSGPINANISAGIVAFPGNATLTDTLISIENIVCGSGNDIVIGSFVSNSINGGAGNDVLSGGAGADVLIGGTGYDVFVFSSTFDSNTYARDVLRGDASSDAFLGAGASSGDRIDVSGIDANATTLVNDFFRFGLIGIGTISLTETGTTTLVQGNTDYDAEYEFILAIEDGSVRASSYTAADFIL